MMPQQPTPMPTPGAGPQGPMPAPLMPPQGGANPLLEALLMLLQAGGAPLAAPPGLPPEVLMQLLGPGQGGPPAPAVGANALAGLR